MLKKYHFYIAILGITLVFAGVLLNPDYIESKNVLSEWKIIKSAMLKYYLIVFGSFFILLSLFLRSTKFLNTAKYLQIATIFIGIIFITLGLYFSPNYLITNFSPTKYLSDDGIDRLLFFQFISITFGALIFLIGSFIFVKKHVTNNKIFLGLLVLLTTILYLLLVKFTYINAKYPSNIILESSSYKKVKDLLLGQDILLSEFEPKSTLKVKRKKVIKAKFPVIDINAHLSSSFRTEYDKKVLAPENLIKSMDSVGLSIVINTDVENGDLEKVLNKYSRKYPDRFKNMWPSGFPAGIITNKRLSELPGELERAVKMGAIADGELWKNLGLKTKDESGKILAVDDPRIDPLWEKAAELNVPILWHMADPPAEFLPVDKFNERFIELRRYPEWSFYGPEFPSKETIMKQRENVFKKHPKTTFIGCHMGWNTDDLDYAGYLLDTYPNYFLDLSTTLSELGRQPYTTRKFFIKYQDRIVFGTDGGSLFGVKGWTVEKFYQAHWEFLETDNEYIDYPMQGAINQGSWKIYGIYLPDSVLKKIYYQNAEKLFHIKVKK